MLSLSENLHGADFPFTWDPCSFPKILHVQHSSFNHDRTFAPFPFHA